MRPVRSPSQREGTERNDKSRKKEWEKGGEKEGHPRQSSTMTDTSSRPERVKVDWSAKSLLR